MSGPQEAFRDLSEEQLREVLFTVACAHPEARDVVIDYLSNSMGSDGPIQSRSVSMSRANQVRMCVCV